MKEKKKKGKSKKDNASVYNTTKLHSGPFPCFVLAFQGRKLIKVLTMLLASENSAAQFLFS